MTGSAESKLAALTALLEHAEKLLGLGVVLPDAPPASAPDGYGFEVLTTLKALGLDPHSHSGRLRDIAARVVDAAIADAAQLAALTAILCTEPGQDVVRRAQRLKDELGWAQQQIALLPKTQRLADALLCETAEVGETEDETIEWACKVVAERDSLRAALAEKEAAYKELDERYTFALNDHEEKLERATTHCTVHNDSVHGAEAEQLRSRLKALITDSDAVYADEVHRILDDVDACDSLAFLERTEAKAEGELARLREWVAELERNQMPKPHPYGCECMRCMASHFRRSGETKS